MKKQITTLCFYIAIVTMPVSVFAQEKGAIRFSNQAFKEVVTVDKKGARKTTYVEPKTAIPGDVILYSIMFKNISDKPVSNIVINDPLPNNSVYITDSATGKNTKISYSIDGGKNYGNPKDLIVKDKSGKSWVAKPEEYTHIRWVYIKPLKPGKKSDVSFKSRIILQAPE